MTHMEWMTLIVGFASGAAGVGAAWVTMRMRINAAVLAMKELKEMLMAEARERHEEDARLRCDYQAEARECRATILTIISQQSKDRDPTRRFPVD